jgi:chloride channel 3/4/5
VTLQAINLQGNHQLTEYTVKYDRTISVAEYVPFVFLGVVGGVFGATFIALNTRWAVLRQSAQYKTRVPIVVEVSCIALFTELTSFYVPACKPIMGSVIHACFESCSGDPEPAVRDLMMRLNLCDGEALGGMDSAFFCQLMFGALVKLVQTSLTFGTGVPAGLFVPSLFMGALLGRAVGHGMVYINNECWHISDTIEPGVYAMVGAASMLGGVCRVTISLTVIMFELTGGLSYVVPFMVGILTSKIVGDALNEGIYDAYIHIRKYPFLHQKDTADPIFKQSASCIMEDRVYGLSLYGNTVASLRQRFSKYRFHGFPLLASLQNEVLLGYLHTVEIQDHLDQLLKEGYGYNQDSPVRFVKFEKAAENPFIRGFTPGLKRKAGRPGHSCSFRAAGLAVWFVIRSSKWARGKYVAAEIDLSDFVDDTVMRMVPETPLEQVHTVFQQLGLKVVFFTQHGFLKGMLTKKNYLKHMATMHDATHTTSQHASAGSRPAPQAVAVTVAKPEGGQVSRTQARRHSTIRRINMGPEDDLGRPLLAFQSPNIPSVKTGDSDEELSTSESELDGSPTLVADAAQANEVAKVLSVFDRSVVAGEMPAFGATHPMPPTSSDSSIGDLKAMMLGAADRQDYATAFGLQHQIAALSGTPVAALSRSNTGGSSPPIKRLRRAATAVMRRTREPLMVREQLTNEGVAIVMPPSLESKHLEDIAAAMPGNRGLL